MRREQPGTFPERLEYLGCHRQIDDRLPISLDSHQSLRDGWSNQVNGLEALAPYSLAAAGERRGSACPVLRPFALTLWVMK